MKRLHKIFAIIALSLIFSFIAVGYAAVSDELLVTGVASVEAPKTIFITNAYVKSTSNMTATVDSYTQTVMNNTVTFNGAATTGTVTYTVTVRNNTHFVSYYQGVTYDGAVLNNSAITKVAASITPNDEKNPFNTEQSKTFDITLTYTKGSNPSTISTFINIKFSELTEKEQAVDIALERFDDILNNETEQGSTFEQLRYEMESGDGLSGRNETYIGNVIGSSSSDSAAVNSLFTDASGNNNLTLDIDGKKTSVTVMIKYEDVTGDDVPEMTIYLTPDKITGSILNRPLVTVYAAVFKSKEETNADGSTVTSWSLYGQLYKGEATTNAYSGSFFASSDSFNTDTWKSTLQYYATNSTNKAPSGSNIAKVMAAYAEYKSKQSS